jgi:hypothetical protein
MRVTRGERRHVQVRVPDWWLVDVGSLCDALDALLELLTLLVVVREQYPVATHGDVGTHVVQRVPVRIPGRALPAVGLLALAATTTESSNREQPRESVRGRTGRHVAGLSRPRPTLRAVDDDEAHHPQPLVGRAVVVVDTLCLEGVLERLPRGEDTRIERGGSIRDALWFVVVRMVGRDGVRPLRDRPGDGRALLDPDHRGREHVPTGPLVRGENRRVDGGRRLEGVRPAQLVGAGGARRCPTTVRFLCRLRCRRPTGRRGLLALLSLGTPCECPRHREATKTKQAASISFHRHPGISRRWVKTYLGGVSLPPRWQRINRTAGEATSARPTRAQ